MTIRAEESIKDAVAFGFSGSIVEVRQLRNGKWRAYLCYPRYPFKPRKHTYYCKVVKDFYGDIITTETRSQLIEELKAEYPVWDW